jgi:Leucine-rich repeat (LRR) protein
MWGIKDFKKWTKKGRPIDESVVVLNISCSNIKKLGDLGNLINLKKLFCDENSLTSLEGIENLINLKYLNCWDNQLTSLEGIENLQYLKYLNCSYNQLTSLGGIENLINLRLLWCYNNSLKSLEGMENLINLQELHCYNNQLTLFEGIEILIKFIKNNKYIINSLNYNFIDSGDYFELYYLFNNLIKCKNNDKINQYIEKIEQMIIKSNGFEKYVLK